MIRKKNGGECEHCNAVILIAYQMLPVSDIPLHYHGAKAHLQPKQEFFYLQGQEGEDQVMVVARILLFSLLGASAYCRKASFAQAGHKMQMEKSAV